MQYTTGEHMPKTPHSFVIQQAYNQIQNDIVDGVLQQGQLVSTAFLNEQLKIEPIYLQEVLCRLIYSSLITTNYDSTFNIINITESMVRDICTTLLQVEEIAITQSIAHGDSAWEEGIHKTLQELENALHQSHKNEWNLLAERNANFHHAIVSHCGSPALLEIRSQLLHKFNTYTKLFIKAVPDHTYLWKKQEEHKKVAQAALDRDAKKACSLNYYHIIAGLKTVIDELHKMEAQQQKEFQI